MNYSGIKELNEFFCVCVCVTMFQPFLTHSFCHVSLSNTKRLSRDEVKQAGPL